MRKAVAGIVTGVVVQGCATAPIRSFEYVSPPRRPEEKALPIHPKVEPLPANFDSGEWAEMLDHNEPAPKPGILISDSMTARNLLYRTRYEELRSLVEADREIWRVQRKYYETRLNDAATLVVSMQPTWWDINKGTVGLVAGFVLGTAVTLGIGQVVTNAFFVTKPVP